MSKWFEPLPLSPPSETQTPASSISAKRAVRGQPLGVLEARRSGSGRSSRRAARAARCRRRRRRPCGRAWSRGVERAQRVELGERDGDRGVRREGWGAKCIMPQPTPCRSASAWAPWIRAWEHVPKPSRSGQARIRPPARPSHVLEHRRVVPRGPRRSSAACAPAPSRGPTSSGRGSRACRPARPHRPPRVTSKSVPASQKVVVPVRIISMQASSAAPAPPPASSRSRAGSASRGGSRSTGMSSSRSPRFRCSER